MTGMRSYNELSPRSLNILLIMGDKNAKVGAENDSCDRAIGRHGCGARNNNANIKLKLRKVKQQGQGKRQLEIGKLKCQNINKEFVLELRNRFCALADSTDEDPDIQTKWETIKNTYVEAATKILGYRDKKNKEWLTPSTWQKIEQIKQLKVKILNTKSLRLQKQVQEAYKTKDKEVKKSAMNDKRAFVAMLACKAEGAARRGEMGAVYKITKQLCGKNSSQSAPVKDKDGNNLLTESEQAARWVQHFREVLNCPEPEHPANPTPADNIGLLNINTSPPTETEVRSAIQITKDGKAAGSDSIHAEMLKADLNTSVKVLTDLFRNIWDKNVIPVDWEGLIAKIPKKGNLQNCNNWRGITLLSIPSKVFCRILLGRIDTAIDTKLRQEQAGFRKGRGCTDQIFTLRNIIEQCLEWNYPLYINFIDFQKAFDSLHRDTLWKIVQSYGVTPKLIALIKMFYHRFECSVITNGNLTDWFPVKSGVRQGCIISPILLLIAIDWSMRKTTSDKPRGIQWTLFTQLEDLDYADDLAILSTNHTHLQEKTDRTDRFEHKYLQNPSLHIWDVYSRTNQSCICIGQTLGPEPVHPASCSQRLTHPNISHPAPAAFRGLQLLLRSFKGNVSARSSMK
ncbi:hypothetical protein SKAU_G00196920 [Synaphobranchus kaupii]|uniref:Reverse transcriptase domain-containing protein n=1 Tax=Synaphobranchus kaupii TaxID=118154 RepID=A0A9Q1FEM5_SYNKA|nr:hypothetical protein SKAU_G00196920 [Synaphobranchus kaupii]